jgi:1,4-dihydroxy-2-naphthoate polyprenyltransferase
VSATPAPARAALWWQGARPRTLGASIVPVAVGTAAATDPSILTALGALVVALGLQVGVNYANDYFDGVRQVDTARRVGPVRLTASGLARPRRVATAAALSFGVAAVAGIALALATAPWLIVLGVAAVAAAVLYSGGPRPYGSRGMGEVFVFLFFGLAATLGTAYVQGRHLPAAAWWAAAPVGLLAVAILMANNIRDISTDEASGKRTLAVRLGDARSRSLYRLVILTAFAIVPAGVALGRLPVAALLALAALAAAARPLVAIGRARGRGLVPVLLGTAATHAAFGFLLAVGLWAR